ncbi:spore germination protein, partial [Bacillus thuringiensis]|uniref:spore germination protein n=1 Tax=Bacillus thuringiensis TaxID=1428 RepID=UPI0011A17F34
MPSLLPNLFLQNTTPSFNLPHFYNLSPKHNLKPYNPSRSTNLPFIINTFNRVSPTNTFHPDVADQDQ